MNRLGQTTIVPDRDLIAAPLDAFLGQNQACCCRTPQMVEVSLPYHSMQFWFVGEIFQFTTQYNISILFRVPAGQTGVITGISVGEHFPGAMTGARITILVNGEAIPSFPRITGLVGLGTGQPLDVWIPLPEAAEVSVLLDCPWENDTFTDHLQFGIPWTVQGYYMDREYFSQTLDNSNTPQVPDCVDTEGYPVVDYTTLPIPEANISTSITINIQPPEIDVSNNWFIIPAPPVIQLEPTTPPANGTTTPGNQQSPPTLYR